MKILVVDDELVSREKMHRIMAGFGESVAVESGQSALTAFQEAWESSAPFDLVALDISMPDMDGTEVLFEIRRKEKENKVPEGKQARVMMVTSHADRDTVITCIQAGCDSYIAKPFNRDTVLEKIEKLGFPDLDLAAAPSLGEDRPDEDNSIVRQISDRFKKGDIDLPSLPQLSIKYRELISKGADITEVAELLKQDAAISSKLIGVSNTTYYRGVNKNENVDQAIGRLGLQVTGQFVDAICTRAFYDMADKKYVSFCEKLWDHSLACAYASQIVSELLDLKLPDDPFTMGLLHDIGKLLLIKVLGELEKQDPSRGEIDETELFEALDQLHGDFGAALLKKWGFSEAFVKMAKHHDNLEATESISKSILVVHLGNFLAKSMGFHPGKAEEIDLEGSASNRILGLDSKMISDVQDQVNDYMEGLGDILT